MASVKHLVDLDLNGNELQNAALHTVANPTGGTIGQIVYNTASNAVFVSNGTSYSRVGLTADGSTITDTNGTISVGSIAISKVTGLQTALDAKATPSQIGILNSGGAPELGTGITAGEVRSLIGAGTSNFSGAYSALSGIPSTFAPSAHTHEIDEVNGLDGQLAAKAPLASPALTGTPTAPTAAGGTNTTQLATTAFVAGEIGRVIDSAPAALDTLNELAASLNDDDDFAGTMTTALAGKLSTSHDMTLTLSGDASGSATFTNMGNATLSVTVADDSHNHTIANVDGLQTALNAKLDESAYTAADILTKIKTVDGAGSGLDADLLDGQSSAYYRNYNNLTNKPSIPTYEVYNITGAGAGTPIPTGLATGIVQVYEAASGNLVMTEVQNANGTWTAFLESGVDYIVNIIGG